MSSPDRIKSLVRWRAGLAIAAGVLPMALFALFERQARRLDALGAEGSPVTARVIDVSGDGGSVSYAYRVNELEYTWNVARGEARYAVGESFGAIYLPSEPSFSRPYVDRRRAATEASSNRAFAWKIELGVGLALGLFALLAHRDLRRLRSGAPSEMASPAAYRRRVIRTASALLPLFLLVTGFHLRDALNRKESVVPVVLALFLMLAIAGGMTFYIAHNGPVEARARSAKLLRWAAPAVVGVALLRLLAYVFGH